MLEQPVQGAAAGGEIRLEARAVPLSPRRRLPGLQPVFQTVGDPEAIPVGARHVPQPPERPGRSAAEAPAQPPDLGHEAGMFARHRGGDLHAQRPSGLVEKDLDAPTRSTAPPASADPLHHALDVLAGAEAVGVEVAALARVDALPQGSKLHHVAAAARRPHPVVAERAALPVDGAHLVDLGAPAPFPPLDLVLIRR